MTVNMLKKPIAKELGGAGVKVDDLQRMADWYGELLAMPVSVNPDLPFYIFDMDDRVNLVLDDYRNMKEMKKFPICQVKTADIDEAYDLVTESGIRVTLEMQRPHPGLAYFNIEDSEGNVLQVTESDWVNPKPVEPVNADHPIKHHINTIVVPVKDLKRATEWYSKLLGNPIKPERQDGGPIYWFDIGILLDDFRNNEGFGKFPTFMLKASNIHEAYKFVKEKNIEVLQDIQFDHYFTIADPEGNPVRICL